MSNKVLSVDRRFVSKPKDESSGDPESLVGKINVGDMGSRVSRSEVPKSGDKGKGKDSKNKTSTTAGNKNKKKSTASSAATSLMSVLQTAGDISYVPSTDETRQTFDLVMSWVHGALGGDQSNDIVLSAADTILSVVKDDNLKDTDKKKQVDEIIGSEISAQDFNQLMNLSKQLTDYDRTDDTSNKEGGPGEEGVAVQFDEEAEADGEGDEDPDLDDSAEDEDDDNVSDIGADESDLTDQEGSEVIEGQSHKSQARLNDEIPAHEIDAYWLQRQLGSIYSDAHTVQDMTSKIFDILSAPTSLGQAENDIQELFDFEHFDFTKILCNNRMKIVWLVRRSQAESDEQRKKIENEIKDSGYESFLLELSGVSTAPTTGDNGDADAMDVDEVESKKHVDINKLQPEVVDLDALVFDQGSHLYSGKEISLPKNTTKFETKTYEEYDIPAPASHHDPDEKRVTISEELPNWTQAAFSNTTTLNRVQSKVFPSAFQSDENLLLCAPTGAGKTNVALLTILRTLSNHRTESGHFRLNDFKVVYIAPLKALVQEQVREFGKKLEPYGIKVAELTGDRNLTKQQISETQMIVTTPEKWDVITRKSTDTSYTNLVRLMIIDEIHLLHDERGPVIESLVSRAVRKSEDTDEPIRLVGLSATLPNYIDVARFLRVDNEKGLFYFDSTYRPVPLAQKFIGITEKKAFKRYQAMNDACYEKVMEYAGKQQVLIFVHSRKETAKTARFLRDKATDEGTLDRFLHRDLASREILKSESEQVQSKDLQNLLPTGFAIHHAGLSRADRTSAEELFAEGQIQVLVCTATLAWGVNLPAHTVIIKGTQVYNPEKGRWGELSPQDVLQMLGRAGRPQYDTLGEGVIITAHSELTYYMSLINAQLPIESQFMSKLADNLNSEVVLGTIRTIQDAVEWLGYTYLYVRMLKDPWLYKVGAGNDDKTLYKRRLDLAYSAILILEKHHLVKYDQSIGRIQSTELGRIASHFYITHSSIATYNQLLKPFLSPIEIFRTFSMSEEFKYIPVRQEEKLELSKLLEKAPVPIRETVEEPAAKINILLQAYISRLKLEGFALMADMVYVTQSAGRLLRAIYEICLRKGWSAITKTTLDLCKMVERRMWLSNSPLRQFPQCPAEVIKKTESSQMPWSRYFDLQDPAEVGQAIRIEKHGKLVFDMLQQFPRLELKAEFQPVTPSLLKMELLVTPLFTWNRSVHGNAETFLILVEDSDGETILFSDTFVLREEYQTDDHVVEFTVPISEPVPPNYFISVISERWLHSEARLAVSFKNLILPGKFPAHTEMKNVQPISINSLANDDERYAELYPNWTSFNKFQSQTFHTLYGSDDSSFIGAAVGCGKSVCAELAILRHWKKDDEDSGKVLYIAPHQEQVDQKLTDWKKRFKSLDKVVNKATGELSYDLQLLQQSDLILATPTQWDVICRRWQRRKNVKKVELFVADDVHTIGGLNGYVYEMVISRMRYMAMQIENGMRIIALSVPLSNGKDIGYWIGANNQSVYNFPPTERIQPMEIHLQSLSIPHHPSLMIAMARPTFYAVKQLAGNESALIFLHERRQCIETGIDLLRHAHTEGDDYMFRLSQDLPYLDDIQDQILKESLEHGIGYLYPAMEKSDRQIVELLFRANRIQVLLATRETCWYSPTAKLVVVMGTQFYEGVEHRYIDYPIIDILQMLGKATRPLSDTDGKALILTNSTKRDYYRKFLAEALPIESHLNIYLHDAFIPEISEQVITSRQDCIDWLTFSYFYHRLRANPSYYGLLENTDAGVSEFLSDLIERTLNDLAGTSEEEVNLIDLEDESGEEEDEATISPLNGAIIASYYNISFVTMQTFALSLSASTKLKGILEIVTSAAEFEGSLPVRNHEEKTLERLSRQMGVEPSSASYQTHRAKAFVILQAHLRRVTLPPDLQADQNIVLEKIIQLLAACVDVLSGDGRLNAVTAMELSQMVVQGVWGENASLKQIPYFNEDRVKRAKAEG